MKQFRDTNYAVSCDGKVINHIREWEVKSFDAGKGYLQVILRVNKKSVHFYVHRMVAEVYCDKPEGKDEVNHIDGNKSNNYYKNLEWCTRSENCLHGFENGLIPSGGDRWNGKFTPTDVRSMRALFRMGVRNRRLTKLFDCTAGTISMITSGKRYKHIQIPV